MKTIVLKLSGPLQAWGTKSHFEYRRTDYYPSKSGMIGLLAACLGYRRDEDEKIKRLNDLDFAVRIDQRGELLRDYHIARKFKDNGEVNRTYVTNRYYLEDGVFLVALGHKDPDFIDSLVKAIRSPYFQPYFGRRSLPVNYDLLLAISDKDPITALKNISWQAASWYKKRNKEEKTRLEIYGDSHLIENNFKELRKDRVLSFSQKERKFAYRYEGKITIDLVGLGLEEDEKTKEERTTDHDAFEAIGGEDVFI